jgi:hypothetical protein
VIGRMLEIKQFLVKLSGMHFINFDDILVDLKLIPETLELPVPRYFVEERQKDLTLREKLIKTLADNRDLERGQEEQEPDPQALTLDDAVRVLQISERGRQGKQRARFMREIRRQEELERKLKETGQAETDPEHAAVVIQKLFRGFKTMRQARTPGARARAWRSMPPGPDSAGTCTSVMQGHPRPPGWCARV